MRRIIAVLAAAALVGGCSSDPGEGSGRLVVFGAASLTEALSDIAVAFEDDHPGLQLTLSFAGTPDLVGQIEQGAQADVFASADQSNMQRIVDEDLAGTTPRIFATNRLAIVVEPGNPRGIDDLADLAGDDLIVTLAAPEVPAGKYTAAMLAEAGIAIEADSLEVDVKAVVARVALGEADAGIVYATDVTAAGTGVEGIEIPEHQNVVARYPIVVLDGAEPEWAAAFVDFVLSDTGRESLRARGFGLP